MKEFFNKNKKIIFVAAAVIVSIVTVILVMTGNNRNKTAKEDTVAEETTETVEALTERETEPEVESENAEKPFVNSLTGEPSDKDYSNARPVAIMLNTIRQSLPQIGNSKADIFIEIPEEGGITRICGLYQDITGVGMLGTIRSTREYFLSFAKSFDAIMAHAGGDYWVLNEISQSGYTTMDCLTNAGGAFWRDEERLKNSSREHTLVTSSDKVLEWIDSSGISVEHTMDDYTVFEFDDKAADSMTDSGESVNVKFSGYKSTSFKYNEQSGKYDVYFWEDEEPYIDSENNEQVAVTNIIVLPVPMWTEADGWGITRQKYDLSGGNGYYICNGKSTEITWAKGDYNKSEEYGNPLKLFDKDGKELKLATGKTYICVLGQGNEVVIE